jgi:hypothetical protein
MKPTVLVIGAVGSVQAYLIPTVTFVDADSAPTLPDQQGGDYSPEDNGLLPKQDAGDILFAYNGHHYLLNSTDENFKADLDVINAAKDVTIHGVFNTSYLQRKLAPVVNEEELKAEKERQDQAAAESANLKAAQKQAAERAKKLEGEKQRMHNAGLPFLQGRLTLLNDPEFLQKQAQDGLLDIGIEKEAIEFEIQRRHNMSEKGKNLGTPSSSSSSSSSSAPAPEGAPVPSAAPSALHPDLKLTKATNPTLMYTLNVYEVTGDLLLELAENKYKVADDAENKDLVVITRQGYVLVPGDTVDQRAQQAIESMMAKNHKIGKPFYISTGFRLQEKFAANEAARKAKIEEFDAKFPMNPPVANQPKNWIVAGTIGATVAGIGSIIHMPPAHSAIHFHTGTAWAAGLVGMPLVAALTAGGVNYLLQCAKIMITEKRKPTQEEHTAIRKHSLVEAGKLGGAVFTAEFFNGFLKTLVDSQTLNHVLGSPSVGRGGFGVTFNGAAMLMTGLGVAVGLCAAIYAQNWWATHKEPSTPPVNASTYLATFAIGFAIGAAAAIGYSKEVANFFMPFISTTALLLIAPTVERSFSDAGTAVIQRFTPVNNKHHELKEDPSSSLTGSEQSNYGTLSRSSKV